jgi:hypothetical protein
MRYLSWAVLYEGISDAYYFDVMIHKLMSEMVSRGERLVTIPENPIRIMDRTISGFAREVCDNCDSFDILFLHLDIGGRSISERISQAASDYVSSLNETCAWSENRCVLVLPKHETEAWVLADAEAVCAALGYNGSPSGVGLPASASEAERILNPKSCLNEVINRIRGGRHRNRSGSHVFASVAQNQRLELLRGSESFIEFEHRLRLALEAYRFI